MKKSSPKRPPSKKPAPEAIGPQELIDALEAIAGRVKASKKAARGELKEDWADTLDLLEEVIEGVEIFISDEEDEDEEEDDDDDEE